MGAPQVGQMGAMTISWNSVSIAGGVSCSGEAEASSIELTTGVSSIVSKSLGV